MLKIVYRSRYMYICISKLKKFQLYQTTLWAGAESAISYFNKVKKNKEPINHQA